MHLHLHLHLLPVKLGGKGVVGEGALPAVGEEEVVGEGALPELGEERVVGEGAVGEGVGPLPLKQSKVRKRDKGQIKCINVLCINSRQCHEELGLERKRL